MARGFIDDGRQFVEELVKVFVAMRTMVMSQNTVGCASLFFFVNPFPENMFFIDVFDFFLASR
jgi:hypothetical protein